MGLSQHHSNITFHVLNGNNESAFPYCQAVVDEIIFETVRFFV